MVFILFLFGGIMAGPIRADEGAPGSGPQVTFSSLLQEMMSPSDLALWPEPAFTTHQASSYDRRSTTPGDPKAWFFNNDFSQFIRMETNAGRREWVMMDADGPGCVDRFWTGGKDPKGTVRFYLDGATQPAIEAPLYQLLAGKDFVAPPLAYETPRKAGNLYLPIPYARHCKITYDEVNPRNPDVPPPARWYNIEYRTYAAGTPVRTFTKADYASQGDQVGKAGRFLTGPWDAPGKPVTLDQEIAPGGEVALDLPGGPNAVRHLTIRLEDVAPGQAIAAYRATVLIGNFDGEQTIWCPVSDFFGSGIGVNVLNNWAEQVSGDGTMSNRWVMPYRHSAKLSLHNFGREKVAVHLEAVVDRWEWNDRSMHFHATWHDQTDIPTRPRSDWNYITVTGKGTYVGDTLSVYNPANKWFGEGDEKIYVDGETFPSHFGTGTEDYYGSAWSFPALFQSVFSNLVLKPKPTYVGETSVTRVRDLDAVTFTKSLKLDMEIWSWADCKMDYTVANYWYAIPGATCATEPQPEAVTRIPKR